MNDCLLTNDLPEQRSLDWYRARLGKFNASSISLLMVSGRKKDEVFGKTALSYIEEVAGERLLAPEVVADDEMFSLYLDMNSTTNKYMQWGIDHEDEARELYQATTGNAVTCVGSVTHPEMPYFACSSDGLIKQLVGGVEIKCPTPKAYIAYLHAMADAMADGETLKAIKPEYYWQIQAQNAILSLDFVDWAIYCPFMAKPISIYRIERDDNDIELMEQRVALAEEKAQQYINKWSK